MNDVGPSEARAESVPPEPAAREVVFSLFPGTYTCHQIDDAAPGGPAERWILLILFALIALLGVVVAVDAIGAP